MPRPYRVHAGSTRSFAYLDHALGYALELIHQKLPGYVITIAVDARPWATITRHPNNVAVVEFLT